MSIGPEDEEEFPEFPGLRDGLREAKELCRAKGVGLEKVILFEKALAGDTLSMMLYLNKYSDSFIVPTEFHRTH